MTDIFCCGPRTICCLLIATVDLVCFISFPHDPWNCLPNARQGRGPVMKPLVLTLKITVSRRSPSQIYSSWTHRKRDLKTLLFLQKRVTHECGQLQDAIVFSPHFVTQACGCFFSPLLSLSSGPTVGLSVSTLTAALPLPAGRWRRLGGGHLDLDREERLHQPAVLQDVRCLHLHTGPGRSRRHGNGRAGLLRHLQGAQEAAASGERLRHATHIVHK